MVSRVPSEWNQEKAQAGVANALQANSDISFIFTSSDFLFPSIVSALKATSHYKKIGEPGHVILGGFDGDATAYQMLKDGYLDATGVQDVYFEAQQSVQALLDRRDGKPVKETILDPGVRDSSGQFAGKVRADVGSEHQEAVNNQPRTRRLLFDWFLSGTFVLGLTALLFFVLAPFTPGLLAPQTCSTFSAISCRCLSSPSA